MTVFTLSNTPSKWAWMVWESLAWPRISSKAGSDTKKKRGKTRRFFSRYLRVKTTDKHVMNIINFKGSSEDLVLFSLFTVQTDHFYSSCAWTYPLRDFWQISSCSRICGSSCPSVSSPMQHCTTLEFSLARLMIFTHDLSIWVKRLASCRERNEIETETKMIKTKLQWR